MKSSLFFLTALFAFTTSVHGSFNASNLMNELPTMGSMISASFNNSLYLFGGSNDTVPYSNELYKLALANNTYNWEVLPQINTPSGTINGQGYVTSDGLNFIIMGGTTEANKNSTLNLQIYTYNFASQTWTANANNSAAVSKDDASVLFNREAFSASYHSLTLETFVLGGALLDGNTIFLDFRKLDANFKVTTLSSPNVGRYGHTASFIGTGLNKIVVLGGITLEIGDPVTNSETMDGSTLTDMQKAWVYTIATDKWDTIILKPDPDNGYPRSRAGHTAVVSTDVSTSTHGDIIIFGGDHGIPGGENQYLNDIAILDIGTWTWTIPIYSGTPPSIRSNAAIELLDNNILTVAFGESSNNTYYNDINAYNTSTNSWLQHFDESSSDSNSGESSTHSSSGESSTHSSSGVSKGLIAGVTVAGVAVILIIVFLLWKFKCCSGGRSWMKDRAS